MDQIQRIYAKVPDVHCKGLCQEACGPVMMSDAEAELIQAQYGFVPWARSDTDLTCTALKDGRCSIYKDRPLICRLWGVVRKMKCPFGCKPAQWMTEMKSRKLLAQMENVTPAGL